MALTAKQAIQQVQDEIKKRGKFSFDNLVNSIAGVVDSNQAELQGMLDQLLKKSGVLSETDEKQLQELLDRQRAEEKKRKAIRAKNFLIGVLALAALGTTIYFATKKHKTGPAHE